jgi:hypothetical protein
MHRSQYLTKDGAEYYYCSDYKSGCNYKELEDGTPIEIGTNWGN